MTLLDAAAARDRVSSSDLEMESSSSTRPQERPTHWRHGSAEGTHASSEAERSGMGVFFVLRVAPAKHEESGSVESVGYAA